MNVFVYKFSLCNLLIAANEKIREVRFTDFPPRWPDGYSVSETPLIIEAAEQLAQYFKGERRAFDLPLEPVGTPFQQSVWQALLTIPYGETRSYSYIAKQIGKAGFYRAVGIANHRNPISIIIPCHRVIGATGNLVGYGGGLELKAKLLSLESASNTDKDLRSL